MPPNYAKYFPVRQYDVDEPISPVSAEPVEERLEQAPKALRRWEWVTRGVLLLLSVVFFALWVTSTSVRKCTFVEKYSPASEAVEYIERVKYKGRLYTITPWRGNESGNPTPDIDAAWRRISTDVKPIRVTEEQVQKMGIEVSPTTVKFPEEEGGGYLVSLEVTHHLGCLDMLRKATYREYYTSFDPTFQIKNETLVNQLDTCVELIRQALMCYPDLNMVMYYWVRGFGNLPVADTNTIHRCKNFEKILDWANEGAADSFPP